KEAQLAAFTMLTDAVEPAARPASRVRSHTPSPLPSTARPSTANAQRGIGLQDATAVSDAITRALAADPELVLDIDWRLRPQDETRIPQCMRKAPHPNPLPLGEGKEADADSLLIIITPLDEAQLGLDVLARLAGRQLCRIDHWQMVRDLFHAREVDPRLPAQA